ncbi:type IX secretion system sortase PorU [Rapidithrix thailandica]|uniref:Type IX secretion system sortase PorU n=1 Tax=Rapidithrix thailandica TaxID=413964 RepID=A0AAW9SCW8_9BACT
MKKMLILFSLIGSCWNAYAQNSVLQNGDVYRIKVDKRGVHKLTYSFLKKLGVPVDQTDPRTIHLYGNGGGMLAQANAEPRVADLYENAIWVEGEADGVFHQGDYVLFFAEGANEVFYDPNKQIIREITHLYEQYNYYYLKIEQKTGKRIAPVDIPVLEGPVIQQYDDYIFHEKEEVNILNSGRKWFGEFYFTTTDQTFSFPVEGLMKDTDIRVLPSVMAQASAPSKFSFSLNQQALGDIELPAVSPYTYAEKGQMGEQVFTVNSNQLNLQNQLRFYLKYQKPNNAAKGYLDYFVLNYQRALRLYETQTLFRSIKSLQYEQVIYEVGNIQPQTHIWEVTNALEPQRIIYESANNKGRFMTEGKSWKEFVAFNPAQSFEPISGQHLANQNLQAMSSPGLLIITPDVFEHTAKRLADFRQEVEGLTTAVVRVSEIYNEFSSGKQDITAIRDFIRHLYLKGGDLKYVLLFGDGSFDYKERLEFNTNFVPVYESEESLHPIESYSSDDFYGFMEEAEGAWPESAQSNDHDLDVGIGRLPVTNVEEAEAIVDKLIHYSENRITLGAWRNQVAFFADDGDLNVHQLQADELAEYIETNYQPLTIKKVFLDAYPQVQSPNGKHSPAVRQELNTAVDKGALIVNFTGHGSETAWTSERILENAQVQSWTNYNKLPLFITATCEFGRHDNPNVKSGAEFAILNRHGGAIGLLTTTRPVFSDKNFLINKAFYEVAFQPGFSCLGDIIRKTKNKSIQGVLNRNFTLLGDPSMRLGYPQEEIAITKINGKPVAEGDTLKALQKITMEGEVRYKDQVSGNFDGILQIQIFDKKVTKKTLGDEGANTIMTFKTFENTLYKGRASINAGKFSFSFVVPKDIAYQFGVGKVSLYAAHSSDFRDAGGAVTHLVVGGSEPKMEDNTAPDMKLFVEDENFVSGGQVPKNTRLLVHLEDENGINTSGIGVGHDIEAWLDEETRYVLNEHYEGAVDNYQKGKVVFPLENLRSGEHTLRVKAWDTHNNSVEKSIVFKVTDNFSLTVKDLLTVPNPMVTGTKFTFTHTYTGRNVKTLIDIYSVEGKPVRTLEKEFFANNETVEVEWDGSNELGARLLPGIYLYQLRFIVEEVGAFTGNGKLLIVK